MINIGIIVGSTRPGRKGLDVGQWVQKVANERSDANYELVDLADFELPLLDEPVPPMRGQYEHEHTKVWSSTINRFDGFVFVTPEYNHGTSAALKNAIDFLYQEWTNKAAGFVGYGVAGGTRAVSQLRMTVGELQIADVQAQVGLTFQDDFENYTTFAPTQRREKALNTMLDQVVRWSSALKPIRD